jgi:membrane protease YdiL (CAAX protease family)
MTPTQSSQTVLETAQATPAQLFVNLVGMMLLMSICIGCIVAWYRWINGVRPSVIAKSPQATIGLIDIVVAIGIVLIMLGVSASIWRIASRQLGNRPEVKSVLNNDSTTEEKKTDENDVTGPGSERSSALGSTKAQPISQESFLFSAFAFSSLLLAVLGATAFVQARTGCSLKSLGWRTDQWREDFLAGLQTYLMITPIVFVLNGVLSKLSNVPYEHPVYDMIESYPWLLGIAFWQVSIIAPIFEEFVFRSLLIGWFESIYFSSTKLVSSIFGYESQQESYEKSDSGETTSQLEQAVENLSPMETVKINAYQPPWWPVVLSGVLFGLAHAEYGISWISLSLLGIILGRLYQIRQSLLPVITVHFLFNSTSILMLGLKLLLPS